MLIGADGSRSWVRKHVFGDEKCTPELLKGMYMSAAFSYGDAAKTQFVMSTNPVQASAIHPMCKVNVSLHDMPDPTRPETWEIQLAVVWNEPTEVEYLSNEQRHRKVREQVDTVCEVSSKFGDFLGI